MRGDDAEREINEAMGYGSAPEPSRVKEALLLLIVVGFVGAVIGAVLLSVRPPVGF